ncbi:MAG TPA: hypothetical protein VIA81_00590 [Acidimicrobiia bacterium]|jgi:hypothetical protein
MTGPAFYARTGTRAGDIVALLHPPYTAWHLAYVAMGAGLAPSIDWQVLVGTLLAFFFGTGIAAHALDELTGRPLRTQLSDATLRVLGYGGLIAAVAVAVVGSFRLSNWLLVWAGAGVLLAAGYALERPTWLHTRLGFALAWGGFPVLVGYWAQTQNMTPAAVAMATAATLLSIAQRDLSTPARHVRRKVETAELVAIRDGTEERWERARLLSTWERPLHTLSWAMVALAVGLLLAKAE